MSRFIEPHISGKLTPHFPLSVKGNPGHIWFLELHALDKLKLHIYLKLRMELYITRNLLS